MIKLYVATTTDRAVPLDYYTRGEGIPVVIIMVPMNPKRQQKQVQKA